MRTLTVTGHGHATAVPDTSLLRLAATGRADALAPALAASESARAAVVRAAGDLVVSTVTLSVWPFRDPERAVEGFEARHALTVACGDLSAAGELLARLAADVGDRLVVEGVDLTVRDPAEALGRAREAAFADARAKAEHLAELAGGSLGEVEAVAEGGVGSVVPVVALAASLAKTEVGLQPGETSLSAALTVTWSLG